MTTYILFDGNCNFCNKGVQWFVKHDIKKCFLATPVQSTQARAILRKHTITIVKLNTIYVVHNNVVYTKSSAVFVLLAQLKKPYKWLCYFKFLPLAITNAVYDFIARNRHRL
jgi:predicted DCC family thiol-disulfide oxidoreductase YuxK